MKILFVRFSSLGDIVLTTGVLKHFKRLNPKAEIHFLTLEQNKTLLRHCSFIDEVHSINKKDSVFKTYRYFSSLSQEFECIVDLHDNQRSLLLKMASKAPVLTYKKQSFLRRLFVSFGVRTKSLKLHVTQKYAEPLKERFVFNYTSLEELRPSFDQGLEYSDQFDVVVHPFASKSTKQWPYYAELLRWLQNHSLKVAVVGFGEFNNLPPGVHNFMNTTSLSDLVRIIGASRLLITNDSGPMHIGVATATETIAIFGSTSREFGFFPEFKNVHIIEDGSVSCRPCHVHGLESCPKKHFRCMKNITLDKITNIIEI